MPIFQYHSRSAPHTSFPRDPREFLLTLRRLHFYQNGLFFPKASSSQASFLPILFKPLLIRTTKKILYCHYFQIFFIFVHNAQKTGVHFVQVHLPFSMYSVITAFLIIVAFISCLKKELWQSRLLIVII